jgi:hypothetical protein
MTSIASLKLWHFDEILMRVISIHKEVPNSANRWSKFYCFKGSSDNRFGGSATAFPHLKFQHKKIYFRGKRQGSRLSGSWRDSFETTLK